MWFKSLSLESGITLSYDIVLSHDINRPNLLPIINNGCTCDNYLPNLLTMQPATTQVVAL